MYTCLAKHENVSSLKKKLSHEKNLERMRSMDFHTLFCSYKEGGG